MERFNGYDAPDYAGTRVEGGIHAFDDVVKPDRSKPEIGKEPIPSKEGAERYAEQVEQILDAQSLFEEDEDLLAA